MAKGKTKPTGTDWAPKANDAINFATIRWFALMMEAKAIELYGTDPSLYPKIEAALNKGLSAIVTIKVKKPITGEENCPPGWVPCGDECAPKCLEDPAEN